nr:Unknown Function [uncultured bacterium]
MLEYESGKNPEQNRSVKLPTETWERIKEIARENGQTTDQVLADAFALYDTVTVFDETRNFVAKVQSGGENQLASVQFLPTVWQEIKSLSKELAISKTDIINIGATVINGLYNAHVDGEDIFVGKVTTARDVTNLERIVIPVFDRGRPRKKS